MIQDRGDSAIIKNLNYHCGERLGRIQGDLRASLEVMSGRNFRIQFLFSSQSSLQGVGDRLPLVFPVI